MICKFSLKKEGNKAVSKNFKVREFKCKGTDDVFIDHEVLTFLQTIRNHYGKPVIITSAYRTESRNKAVGGAGNSQHLKGKAVDFYIKGVDEQELYLFCDKLIGDSGGVGYYPDGHYVHIDTRGTKARWETRG